MHLDPGWHADAVPVGANGRAEARGQHDQGCVCAPPSSVVVNTPGRESGGSWFETCSGVWYPRRRPCGVAVEPQVLSFTL